MSYKNNLFFSIVIPAHNEEKYIANTLDKIQALNYPKEYFEVIVVENGSTDNTFNVIKLYVADNLSLYVSEKGVSKAKNFGLNKISQKSQWVVFLDADTILKDQFLAELNIFLNKNQNRNYAIGTSTVLPNGKKRLKAFLWFGFYNIGHKLSKTSFAIQIAKSSLIKDIKFDESLKFAEDLKFIKNLRRFGKFFYFRTKQVVTSTRRFDEAGWLNLFIKWNWQALVLAKTKKKTSDYRAVR